jgi:hypothetical protein
LSGQFDVTRHGGPFHVQLTTPDGNTAQVDFPGTGFRERRSLPLNPLGQGVELSLLPGEATTPVRGFYLGEKGISVTPLVLEAVHSSTGRLQIAKDLDQLQLVLFDPRRRTSQTLERTNLKKGDVVEFEVAAPYTLFTAGAFLTGQPQPFEGWGIVIPPVNFEATLTAPQTAQPGETIEVEVAAVTHTGEPAPVFCWLLVYDARLEHESPIPKLAKQIYQSIQAASQQLQADAIKSVSENPFGYQFGDELFLRRTSIMPMAMPTGAIRFAAAAMSEPVAAGMAQIPAAETATLIETPARMEFPELAYQELFFIGGQTGRTIQLGDQIGLWRVRAYLFRGADYRELTVDVQADKRLYAELNLPAIASDGDRIMASVNYQTHDAAQLTINTRFGETRLDVTGSGTAHFPIEGPTQVDVRLENSAGSDWSVREVAAPGRQTVKASRLALLRTGETAQGERVVVYRTVGEVLKETIDALTNYPFG